MPVENQRLARTVTLWPIVLFGLAYITPMISITLFGIVSEASEGAITAAYTFAFVAMLFTAMSYAKMAGAFPIAGSAYTYVRRTMDDRLGFMVGWSILLDYFFIQMVAWLIGAWYLHDQFPSVPVWVFIIAFIVTVTTVNLLGIKLATTVNIGLMAFQMLIIIFFVILSLREAGGSGVTLEPFYNDTTGFSAISAGAAIAVYCFIGFDGVSTFAEEAINPTKTIPRAIILTATIAFIIFLIVTFSVQLAHPGGEFEDAGAAATAIANDIGGNLFESIVLAGVILAQWTATVPAQASSSRLMFAMGRDGVLPKPFAYVLPRFRTPAFCLLLTGAIGLIGIFLDITTSTSFINFGAFVAFTFVNFSVIALFIRERRRGMQRNVLGWVVAPLIGAGVCVWLLTNLDRWAIILGIGWLVIGFLYLLYLTRFFRKSPPVMDFSEEEEILASGEASAQPA